MRDVLFRLDDALPTSVALVLCIALASSLIRSLDEWERRLMWASFAAHWVGMFALDWLMVVYYDGIGDSLTFFRNGTVLGRYMSVGPPSATEDVVALLFQRPVRFPFTIHGTTGASGTMSAVAAFLLKVIPSKYAIGGSVATLAFSGKVALYRFLRAQLERRFHSRALFATMLLPSAVFWTSGFLKEAFATCGLGWSLRACGELRAAQWRSVKWLATGAFGLFVISLTKAYLLLPFGVAVSIWLTHRPARGETPSPWRLVAGLGLAALAVLVVGQIFPQFSLSQVGENIAARQERGAIVGGGSYIEVGDPTAQGLPQQLLFAPLGVLSVLFRPFIFEVSGAAMAVNALETLALTVLVGRVLWLHGVRGVWRALNTQPALLASLAFVLVAAVGVGLTTTNMGTLSRYRVPLMPFYLTVVLVVPKFLDAERSRAGAARRARPGP